MIEVDKRNYTLDLLRFLASFMVVIFHLNEPIIQLNNWYRDFAKQLWLGVPIFFVISGYCILLSAKKANGPGMFAIRRFFRIFPPYWFSICLILLIAIFQKFITGTNSIQNIPKDLESWSITISLLTAPFSKINTLNWVYWSLTCELMFYFIMFLIAFFKRSLWYYLLAAVTISCFFFYQRNTGPLFFFSHWPAFSLGLGVYALHFEKKTKSLIIFIVFTALSVGLLVMKMMMDHQVNYFVITLLTFIIITLSPYFKLEKNFFTKLGDQSYAVYLIHVPIAVFLLGGLKTNLIQMNIYLNITYDLGMYILVSLIAYFVYQYFETPVIVIGKKVSLKFKSNTEV